MRLDAALKIWGSVSEPIWQKGNRCLKFRHHENFPRIFEEFHHMGKTLDKAKNAIRRLGRAVAHAFDKGKGRPDSAAPSATLSAVQRQQRINDWRAEVDPPLSIPADAGAVHIPRLALPSAPPSPAGAPYSYPPQGAVSRHSNKALGPGR